MSDTGSAHSEEFQACRSVGLHTHQRVMDARTYSAPFNIAQLLENAYAVFDRFNATSCVISVLEDVESFVRPVEPAGQDGAVQCGHGLAIQVLDNGCGISHEIVDSVLRYGHHGSVRKKLGFNNHGLKAACSGLSPAWALIFSKYKDRASVQRSCIIGYGSNFDLGETMDFVVVTWPSDLKCNTWEELEGNASFLGDQKGCQRLFRNPRNVGKRWAPLKDLQTAYRYLDKIEDHGVLALFPWDQPLQGIIRDEIQAEVQADDIVVQGVSMTELITYHFVDKEMQLSDEEYWKGFQKFTTYLEVQGGVRKPIAPYKSPFAVSPPLKVSVGNATHTVVYGPFQSLDKLEREGVPYNKKDGNRFYNENYRLFLASNSRVMNPLHNPPSMNEYYGSSKQDYFGKKLASGQKAGAQLTAMLLASMCGQGVTSKMPREYSALQKLLDKYQVYSSTNPNLKVPEVKDHLNSLKWLLGLPFEIFVRVDQDYLAFNDKKNDITEDATARAKLYSAVHSAVALDVMKRMEPGLEGLIAQIQKAPASTPAPGKGKGRQAGPSSPVPPTPAQKPAAQRNFKARKRPATQTAAVRKKSKNRVPKATSKEQDMGQLGTLMDAVDHVEQHPLRSQSREGSSSGVTANRPPFQELRLDLTSRTPAAGNDEPSSSHHYPQSTQKSKYGSFGPMHQAITACLNTGDVEVLGPLAMLATVEDANLSQVLATYYSSTLAVLVVESSNCEQRINTLLGKQGLPLPDVFPLTLCKSYELLQIGCRGPTAGEMPLVSECGARAAGLMQTACLGSDDLLPIPLPHEESSQGASEQWPAGCLGYAVNLVKPCFPTHRSKVLSHLLGSLMVFETKDQACAYRHRVIQDLELYVPNIVTLDGRYVSAIGIVSGASFQPLPLQLAPYCFGCAAMRSGSH